MSTRILATAATLFLLAGEARAAIQLNVLPGALQSYADDNAGSGSLVQAASGSNSTSITATDGSGSATLGYTYQNEASQAVFRINYGAQLGPGDLVAHGYADFAFTLSETVTYSLSGMYGGSSNDSSNNQYLYEVRLRQTSAFPGLFVMEEESRTAASAAFIVDGLQQGTSFSQGRDPLTGTLAPGTYLFISSANISGNTLSSGTTRASGFMQLTLNSNAPVPEPSTLAMFSLGGLGLAFGALRRRVRKVAGKG